MKGYVVDALAYCRKTVPPSLRASTWRLVLGQGNKQEVIFYLCLILQNSNYYKKLTKEVRKWDTILDHLIQVRIAVPTRN